MTEERSDQTIQRSERPKMKKRTRIGFVERTVVHVYCDNLTREQRKYACWYSNAELEECRLDAKLGIKLLLHFKGDISRIDKSKVTVRGLEKYGSIELQELKRKKVAVRTVLHRQKELRAEEPSSQSPKNNKVTFSSILSTLSQPSIILARKLASPHPVLSCDCWKEDLARLSNSDTSRAIIQRAERHFQTEEGGDVQKRELLSDSSSSSNKRRRIVAATVA